MSSISMETLTLTFFDETNKQPATIIIRAIEKETIGLCLSLEQDGDVEVFLGRTESETVLQALQKAVEMMSP